MLEDNIRHVTNIIKFSSLLSEGNIFNIKFIIEIQNYIKIMMKKNIFLIQIIMTTTILQSLKFKFNFCIVTPGFKGKSECKNTCAPGSSYTHASTQ
jgi:hypothetical protein